MESISSSVPSNRKPGQSVVLVGLGFGDESKGATVDYLCSQIPDVQGVVRWSGGTNAAHNVRHGPRHHTFRQFGSGTFLQIPTYFLEGMVVDPFMLEREAEALESLGIADPMALITADERCLVVTPIMAALNRAREILRGRHRHGSTGSGQGETVAYALAAELGLEAGETIGNFELPNSAYFEALRLGQLSSRPQILSFLQRQETYALPLIKRAQKFMPELTLELTYPSLWAMATHLYEIAQRIKILPQRGFLGELKRLDDRGTLVFEGSQGLLLDEYYGFHPHTTWSTIHPGDLISLLRESGFADPYVLGISRSFHTRHGAGPLPTETNEEFHQLELPEDDNSWGRFQGELRSGPLDLRLLRYSAELLHSVDAPLNGVALSHLDVLQTNGRILIGDRLLPDSEGRPSAINVALRRVNLKSSAEKSFFVDVSNASELLDREETKWGFRVFDLTDEPSFIHLVEAVAGAPVVIGAYGSHRRDRKLR